MELTEFLVALLIIIMIDIVLGGDNAIVIALASRNLPKEQQKKAIWLGAGLAILIRAVLTLVAVWLLEIPYLMLIGGILLIFIAFKLLKGDKKHDSKKLQAGHTLAGAVRTIIFADVVMGLDNVLAIAGASHGNPILIILGLLISIPIIIWGSRLILFIMTKYPIVVYVGAAVLAFTAGSMITHEQVLTPIFEAEPYLNWIIPAALTVMVPLISYLFSRRVVPAAAKK